MKTPAPNKSNPEANTKKLRNRIFALNVFILQLLETLHPLRELPFADTPLATDSESGQFLALEHPMHGSSGQLQHVSGLLESQQAQRLITVFRRCFHVLSQIEQRQCHDLFSRGRTFVGKSSSAVDDMKGRA